MIIIFQVKRAYFNILTNASVKSTRQGIHVCRYIHGNVQKTTSKITVENDWTMYDTRCTRQSDAYEYRKQQQTFKRSMGIATVVTLPEESTTAERPTMIRIFDDTVSRWRRTTDATHADGLHRVHRAVIFESWRGKMRGRWAHHI